MNQRAGFRGALLGLAAGDALGTTLEFQPPGSFEPITDVVGGGPFSLPPGAWTDDTSMTLCLAASLVECRGFNAHDQMQRYVRWWREGYMSSTGQCFDIGNTVAGALRRFVRTDNPFSGSTDPYSAGNGSIMRLAPVSLFFSANPQAAIKRSGESSRTTHGATTCVDACRYLGALIVGALNGESKDRLLSPSYCPVPAVWQREPLHSEIAAIANGSFKQKHPREIRGTGFVVHSLEAALWAFWHSEDFRDGCLKAVNLGDDADTTGAVYGQLAGAYYGETGIPAEWRAKLVKKDAIEEMADRLFAFASGKETIQ